MSPRTILLTASPALTDYWVDALELTDALRLTDATALCCDAWPAGTMVLWDLALSPLPAEARIVAACQRYRVLALSSLPSDEEGMIWLQWGAVGYAHALSTGELLRQVVDTMEAGGTWVGQTIMRQLCARFGQRVVPAALHPAWSSPLSTREMQVVEALRLGLHNKEIARQLGVTERTVKAHLTSVFHKFGVEDRLQLLIKLTDA